MTAQDAIHALWTASLATPMDLKTSGARDIAVALNLSLACIFALYPKAKSYRWHLCEAALPRRARCAAIFPQNARQHLYRDEPWPTLDR